MLRFFSGKDASTELRPIPPIDGMVPAHIETATFAVG